MPALTRRAADFVLFGADEGERHAACYAAAVSLREAGATPDVAWDALLRGAAKCGLDDDDVLKVWRRMFGAGRGYEGSDARAGAGTDSSVRGPEAR